MVLPVDIVFVRHGQSEGNLSSKRGQDGDPSCYENIHFKKKHTSMFRLTHLGVKQAEAAGKWLKENFKTFDSYYVSEYIRAMETAAHLKIDTAHWRVEFMLRERDWGSKEHLSYSERRKEKKIASRKRDGFYFTPKRGESLANMCMRLSKVLDRLNTKSDERVVVVCHGEVMMGFRVLLENMTQMRWRELEDSDVPKDKIRNGHILHYTRRDPVTAKLHKKMSHMRSICPWDETLSSNVWTKMSELGKKKYTNKELLAQVHTIPLIITNDSPNPLPNEYSFDELDNKFVLE